MKIKNIEEATVEVEFECPFCILTQNKQCQVVRQKNGEPALVHPLPYCQQFQDLSPDEFLKQVRAKMGMN